MLVCTIQGRSWWGWWHSFSARTEAHC